MLKTAANPSGLPIEVFAALRLASLADRAQGLRQVALDYDGFTEPGGQPLIQGLAKVLYPQVDSVTVVAEQTD